MATTLVEQIKKIKCLFGDTSMKIGMNSLCESSGTKTPTTTKNVKMVATNIWIF